MRGLYILTTFELNKSKQIDMAELKESQPFKIKYNNPDSSSDGQEFLVREIEGFDHHYWITDGGSMVGGGKLARKYCKKI